MRSGLTCGLAVTALSPDDRHVRWQVKIRKVGPDIGTSLDGPANQPPSPLSAPVPGLQHHAGIVLAGVTDDASRTILSQPDSGMVEEYGPLPFVVEGGDDLVAPLAALMIVGVPLHHPPHEVIVVRIDPCHRLSIDVVSASAIQH